MISILLINKLSKLHKCSNQTFQKTKLCKEKSNKQRAKDNEQRVLSKEKRAEVKVQQVKSEKSEQRVTSKQ